MKEWLRDHPWVMTAFAIGALFGVLLCLPLLPYELPESAANVIGAALGAIFAVWGAAWITDAKERKQQRSVVRGVAATVQPVVATAEAVVEYLSAGGRPAQPGRSPREDNGASEVSNC